VREGVGASSLASEDRACGPSDLSRCASQPEALVPLRVLSLFAGIGGFDLGLERTGGFKTVAFCEIDPFCRRVLAKHWPEVPCYHDVRELAAEQIGPVDVICGGFPCQDISTAGTGAGIDGKRSGLWSEYARLIGELRPRYVIVENVAALLGRGLGRVLGDLAALGYDAEWDCIPASAIGAPHRRDRIWIVAYPSLVLGDGGEHNRRGYCESAVPLPELRDRGGHENVANSNGRDDTERLDRRANSGTASPSESGHARKGQTSHGQRLWSKFGPGRSSVADAERGRLESGHEQRAWPPAILATAYGRHRGGREFGEAWRTEPDVGRVAYGVPDAMDRLKSLGNAVVPQISELIGRAILAAIADTHPQGGDVQQAPSLMSSGGAKQSPKTCPS
jgi:DNA (cytosine-5)-methyltransferase 1